jgi:sugar lactone lactonase YvrE
MKRSVLPILAVLGLVWAALACASASAEVTVLCKVKEDPCKAANIYPKETAFKAVNKGTGFGQMLISTSNDTIFCRSLIEGTVSGSVGNNQGLSISKWRLGEEGDTCDSQWVAKEDCGTNEAQKTPYKAAAVATGEGEGEFAVQGASWHIDCYAGGVRSINCTYSGTTKLASLGLGEGLLGKIAESGTVLRFYGTNNHLAQSEKGCPGTEANLEGTYEFVEPTTPMYASWSGPNATTQKATHITAKNAWLNGTINPNGSATTYYFEYGTTTSYGSKTSTFSAGSGISDVAVSKEISGLTADTSYHYRLVAKYENGLESNGADMTVGPPVYRSSFGASGEEEDQFIRPSGIAIDPSGNVWVADHEMSRIEKWSPGGKFLFAFGGEEGSEEGQLSAPSGVAIDSKGNLWVADTGNSRIEEFNSKGEFLLAAGEGQLESPEGIAIDPEGHIWVTDRLEGCLQEFDSEGNLLFTKYGKFEGPTGIAITPLSEGFRIYVADRANNRVYLYLSLKSISKYPILGAEWGTLGSGNGQFNRLSTLATDSEGNVWVIDEGNYRVQEFTAGGEYITRFESKGVFASPSGIAADPSGNIWVADAGQYRVDRWAR